MRNLLCLAALIYIIISGLIGCSELGGGTLNTTNNNINGNGIALPSELSNAALPTGDMISYLYIDDDLSPVATKNVDIANNQKTISFENIPVPTGEHTITITFKFQSTSQALITIASSTTDPINVTEGTPVFIEFKEVNYSYPDDDNDMFSNLFELGVGTIPGTFTHPASLIDLQLNGSNLAQTFQANRLSYTDSVAFLPDSITVTAKTIDTSVTAHIDGKLVPSEQISEPVPLILGNNPISILVTAADNSSQTYTINVARSDPEPGIFRVVLTGDGAVGFPATTNLGPTTMSIMYDVKAVEVGTTTSFSNGTGVIFSVPDIPVSVVAGTTSYSVDPITEISLFETTTNNQLNFKTGGSIAMQWNDFTMSAFFPPIPTDFVIANALALNQIVNNVNLTLSNGSVNLRNSSAAGPADIMIDNVVVTIEGLN